MVNDCVYTVAVANLACDAAIIFADILPRTLWNRPITGARFVEGHLRVHFD